MQIMGFSPMVQGDPLEPLFMHKYIVFFFFFFFLVHCSPNDPRSFAATAASSVTSEAASRRHKGSAPPWRSSVGSSVVSDAGSGRAPARLQWR